VSPPFKLEEVLLLPLQADRSKTVITILADSKNLFILYL